MNQKQPIACYWPLPRNPFLATAIKTDGLTVIMASEIVINTETENKTNNGALLLN